MDVIDDRSAELELAHDALSPRVARRFVTTVLDRWRAVEDTIEVMTLLVSELVSNAVLHASGPVRVALSRSDGGRYRVEVANPGETSPLLRRGAHREVSGRGLQIVDEFARDWGTRLMNGETVVWFEVDELVST